MRKLKFKFQKSFNVNDALSFPVTTRQVLSELENSIVNKDWQEHAREKKHAKKNPSKRRGGFPATYEFLLLYRDNDAIESDQDWILMFRYFKNKKSDF